MPDPVATDATEDADPPGKGAAPTGSKKASLAWAFYDWANSAYAVSVLTLFMPLQFKDYWNDGVSAEVSSFRWGVLNSLISAIIALSAPVLGAMADKAGRRRGMLVAFAGLGVLSTGCLALVARGEWLVAGAAFLLSGIGFAGANIFYDSLLVTVARPNKRDKVSVLGYSLGYLGGGVMLAINVWMVQNPASFGFASTHSALMWSFVVVALWWALFTVPVLLWVPADQPVRGLGFGELVRQGFHEVGTTLRGLKKQRNLVIFLLAYWLYIDGVDTIIRMAVDYGKNLKIPDSDLVKAILVTQFVGFPAALIYGYLGEKVGARRALLAGIVAYMGITCYAFFLTKDNFMWLAIAVGCVQGGVQALSRSYYSRLVPQDQASQYYGLYNMLGKSAAIVGPLLMGSVGLLVGDIRYGILSLLLLFVAGGALLWMVPAAADAHPAVTDGNKQP